MTYKSDKTIKGEITLRYRTIAPRFGVAIPKSTSKKTEENRNTRSMFFSFKKNNPAKEINKHKIRNKPSRETIALIKLLK
jgi:hypothetical protein